jgi:ribosomal protein S6--L-glutamate ligase
VNGREAILTSRNKGGVLATLDRAGLPTPATTMVSNPASESTLERVFERFDPPVVVKPNSATRGVGVTKVHDVDSFLGVCDYLGLVHDYRATGDKAFLVQEYLPDARDLRVMTVEGEYVGAVERRLPDAEPAAGDAARDPGDSRETPARGGWKHNVHRGAVAEGVDPPAEVRHLAERAARELGVDFLGVDLLVSGDRVVVSETNARPTIDDASKYEPEFYDRLAALVRARAE